MLLFIAVNRINAQITSPSWETTLQGYIDTALKNNPSVQAYQYQSDALHQKIITGKAMDDPMIYAGIMNLPVNFNFTMDMMTMKQVGVQQNFSVGKKYTLRTAMAQKEYETSTFDIVSQRLVLVKLVKQQYYDLYALDRNIETVENSISAMKNYFNIANSRYGNGEGTQQDVFKAQVEITKMQEDLIKMQSMREDAFANFNSLLHRDKRDSVDVVSEIKFRSIELSMDSLMMNVEMNNPMLQSTRSMLGKDSVSYQLAKATKIPDFNAGVWYGQRQGMNPDGSKAKDMIGFSVGMTLPIYSKQKQDPLIAESGINIQRSQSLVDAAQNEISLMLHHAMTDANKNEKLISLYENQLIPQATANLNAGITGYQQNKIDFMTLTDNFLSLYNDRLKYYQSIADYMKAIAEMEMLTATNINNK